MNFWTTLGQSIVAPTNIEGADLSTVTSTKTNYEGFYVTLFGGLIIVLAIVYFIATKVK